MRQRYRCCSGSEIGEVRNKWLLYGEDGRPTVNSTIETAIVTGLTDPRAHVMQIALTVRTRFSLARL
jgi:hypothetical protein